MGELIALIIMVGVLVVGFDVITRPVPVFNKIYRRSLKFFLRQGKKQLKSLEKATRAWRVRMARRAVRLVWQGICAIGRGIRAGGRWVRARVVP